jgi:hypothetical protein
MIDAVISPMPYLNITTTQQSIVYFMHFYFNVFLKIIFNFRNFVIFMIQNKKKTTSQLLRGGL